MPDQISPSVGSKSRELTEQVAGAGTHAAQRNRHPAHRLNWIANVPEYSAALRDVNRRHGVVDVLEGQRDVLLHAKQLTLSEVSVEKARCPVWANRDNICRGLLAQDFARPAVPLRLLRTNGTERRRQALYVTEFSDSSENKLRVADTRPREADINEGSRHPRVK